MASEEGNWFYALPALTSEKVAKSKSGHELSLVLLEYVGEGAGVVFQVQYVHRELIYRTPGKKDAVAFGIARLEGEDEFKEVRILFSKSNATATLRGLVLEGQVKEGYCA